MKGEIKIAANWRIRNEEFMISDIRLAIKDGLPKSTRDELYDHPEDYCSLTYEYWCDLLSTIKVKDESKMVSGQINKIAFSRESSLSDSNNSLRITRTVFESLTNIAPSRDALLIISCSRESKSSPYP